MSIDAAAIEQIEREIEERVTIVNSHNAAYKKYQEELLDTPGDVNNVKRNILHMRAYMLSIHAMAWDALDELRMAKREIEKLNKERENN